MARGRMIDKRISKSKKLAIVSDRAKVLWFMVYPHLDCEGCIEFGDLEDLKDECCSKFKNYSFKSIATALNNLAGAELVDIFPQKNGSFALRFDRFHDFQIGIRKDREAPSKIKTLDNSNQAPDNYRFDPALRLKKFKEGRKEINIYFDFDQRNFFNIKEEDITGWQEAYRACDIKVELLKMREWLLANPDKAKKNYRRFITNWLIRAQDQGGTKKWEQEQQSEKGVGVTPKKSKTPEQEKRLLLIEKKRTELKTKHKSALLTARKNEDQAQWDAIMSNIGNEVATYSRQLEGEG